jgi:hypothetical protein
MKGGALTQLDGSPVNSKLWNTYQEDATRSCAEISYYPPEGREEAFLGATVLLGTATSPIVYDICKVLLTNRNLKYRIMFDFWGLVEGGLPETPSVKEFTHPDILTRRAYITSGIWLILPTSDLPV